MRFAVSILVSSILPATAFANVDNAAVAREIIATVKTAQKAGFERGDYETYMSIWAPDAKIVSGRGPKPGKFDGVTSRSDIAKTRRMRISSIPKGLLKLTFQNVAVSVDEDVATMDTVARIDIGEDGDREVVHEVYRLRKIDGKWRVFEDRFWPVSGKTDGQLTTYDEATWKRLDAAVAENETPSPASLEALMKAFRFSEAFVVSQKLTDLNPKDAQAWSTRGWIAIAAGKGDDALNAFKTALRLDPDAVVPPSVKPTQKQSDTSSD